jgi:hypothetical protein
METRADVADKICELRFHRGRLAQHGKDLASINREIADAEAALAVFDDREQAEQADLREQQLEQHATEIKSVRAEIESLRFASANALSDSRAGYVQGAAAMRTHLEHEAALRKQQARLNEMTGAKASIENQFELERKRSMMIASVGLKAITNHPTRFGRLEWPMSVIEWKE